MLSAHAAEWQYYTQKDEQGIIHKVADLTQSLNGSDYNLIVSLPKEERNMKNADFFSIEMPNAYVSGHTCRESCFVDIYYNNEVNKIKVFPTDGFRMYGISTESMDKFVEILKNNKTFKIKLPLFEINKEDSYDLATFTQDENFNPDILFNVTKDSLETWLDKNK